MAVLATAVVVHAIAVVAVLAIVVVPAAVVLVRVRNPSEPQCFLAAVEFRPAVSVDAVSLLLQDDLVVDAAAVVVARHYWKLSERAIVTD